MLILLIYVADHVEKAEMSYMNSNTDIVVLNHICDCCYFLSLFLEYYTCCDIEFMGLANIHSVRKSFNTVHALCSNNSLDQTT